jgi:hypothetical protein
MASNTLTIEKNPFLINGLDSMPIKSERRKTTAKSITYA